MKELAGYNWIFRSFIMEKMLCVLGLVLIVNNVLAQEPERYTGPIIDMHLHSYGPDEIKNGSPNPVTGEISVDNATDHYQQSIEYLKTYNVVLAVVDGNTLDSVEPWQRLMGKDAIITGLRGLPSLDEFKEMVSSGELEIFGEVAPIYAGDSLAAHKLMPYYAIAEEHDIPVAIHVGGSHPGITRYNKDFRLRLGDPLLLEDVLVAFPNLRIYMMHPGVHFYQNAIIMMVQYPWLYVDIAVATWVPDARNFLEPFLRMAKEHDLLDRVMYGTDQMVWPEAIEMSIENVQSLDFLTLEEKRGIFYNNAARFLRLSEAEIAQHQIKN